MSMAYRDALPADDQYKRIVKHAKDRKKGKEVHGFICAKNMRNQQSKNNFNTRLAINTDRKNGTRKGKFRDASSVDVVELEKPASESNKMKLSNFSRNAQKRYIIEEILHRQIMDQDESTAPDYSTEKDRLHKLGIRDLRQILRNQLTNDATAKSKDIDVELQSPLGKELGAHNLIKWTNDDEKNYLQIN